MKRGVPRFSFRWSGDRAGGLALVGMAQVSRRSRRLEDITLFTGTNSSKPYRKPLKRNVLCDRVMRNQHVTPRLAAMTCRMV